MLMQHDDVNKISILHSQSTTVSVCGSATFGVGVEGILDLYHDKSGHIASLSWYGPWSCIGNELLVHDLAEDKFAVEVSSPPNKGILGDLIVNVKDCHSTKSSCFISCITANVLSWGESGVSTERSVEPILKASRVRSYAVSWAFSSRTPSLRGLTAGWMNEWTNDFIYPETSLVDFKPHPLGWVGICILV